MPIVPQDMMLAKIEALPRSDYDFIMALIDTRIARAAKQTTRLRLVVPGNTCAIRCDFLGRN